MKTVRTILIELLDKKDAKVFVKYRGNSIMIGDAHEVLWTTSTFLQNCHATVESYKTLGKEINEIIIKDGEL